jgi:hypothetical protein
MEDIHRFSMFDDTGGMAGMAQSTMAQNLRHPIAHMETIKAPVTA